MKFPVAAGGDCDTSPVPLICAVPGGSLHWHSTLLQVMPYALQKPGIPKRQK